MVLIAGVALAGIAVHLILRYGMHNESPLYQIPLRIVLAFGGIPLVYELLKKVAKLEIGSDLLAGISIVTAAVLGEYLAGALVVLMLSGGEALESYAVRSASSRPALQTGLHKLGRTIGLTEILPFFDAGRQRIRTTLARLSRRQTDQSMP